MVILAALSFQEGTGETEVEWFVTCEDSEVWGLRRHPTLTTGSLHLHHKCSGGRHMGRSQHTHTCSYTHMLSHTHMFTHIHAHTHIATSTGRSPEPESENGVAIPPPNTHVRIEMCVSECALHVPWWTRLPSAHISHHRAPPVLGSSLRRRAAWGRGRPGLWEPPGQHSSWRWRVAVRLAGLVQPQ